MQSRTQRRADVLMRVAIGPVLLALAGVLAWHSEPAPLPVRSLAEVQAGPGQVALWGSLATQPLRRRQTAPPVVELNGFRRDCQDCHRVFVSHDDTPRGLRQHQEIAVVHGINSRCFNCHHPSDRNLLTLRDGSPIPYDREEELCSQCHGTTYRDWQQGMHGKTLGYWSPALGEQQRLICTECHDPHRPAFRSLMPLPGPHTLRMGEQQGYRDEEPAVERNPLRTWSRGAGPGQSRGDR
jgi:hypothetical protein